jgi:hypothetical protein
MHLAQGPNYRVVRRHSRHDIAHLGLLDSYLRLPRGRLRLPGQIEHRPRVETYREGRH